MNILHIFMSSVFLINLHCFKANIYTFAHFYIANYRDLKSDVSLTHTLKVFLRLMYATKNSDNKWGEFEWYGIPLKTGRFFFCPTHF